MNKLYTILFFGLIFTSCAKDDKISTETKTNLRIEKHIDSVSYAIGLDVAMRIKQQFKDIDYDLLSRGIEDYNAGIDLFLTDKERVAVIKKYNDITVPKYRMDLEKLHY